MNSLAKKGLQCSLRATAHVEVLEVLLRATALVEVLQWTLAPYSKGWALHHLFVSRTLATGSVRVEQHLLAK